MAVYANAAELAQLVGPSAPTGGQADRLLTRASRRIDRALLTARYDPDAADVIAVLREATLETASHMIDNGAGTGALKRRRATSIGSVSVAETSSAETVAAAGIGTAASDVLSAAGLLGHAVGTIGPHRG